MVYEIITSHPLIEGKMKSETKVSSWSRIWPLVLLLFLLLTLLQVFSTFPLFAYLRPAPAPLP